MPDDLNTIEKTVRSNGGSADDLAAKLEVEKDIAEGLISSYLVAKKIVYAEKAVESFRLGVKQSIIYALEQGLNSSKDIDDLVGRSPTERLIRLIFLILSKRSCLIIRRCYEIDVEPSVVDRCYFSGSPSSAIFSRSLRASGDIMIFLFFRNLVTLETHGIRPYISHLIKVSPDSNGIATY